MAANISERDENGMTTTATMARTRIFVGGLGATVTAEDLRNTFASLGKMESVDIVRTKGRSFAYFDFLPSSQKSLTKLFSTYNGCMWKGGRLRLEKAKEHYLIRLRREWAEVADFADNAPSSVPVPDIGSLEKLNNVLNPERMEVQLFFPKLKKVKPLPFTGTGKHKYSFQRVEIPPLPIHFCDCEEHSDPSHPVKEKDIFGLETHIGGIDEKELNMMESVMNKLFEREYNSKAAYSGAALVKEGDSATKSVDDLLVHENEPDYTTDEDNLVINVVAGTKNRIDLLGRWGQETLLANEGAIVDELQTSKDRQSKNVLKSQRRKILPSDKKRKSPLTEEIVGNEVVSAYLEKKGNAKSHIHESARGESVRQRKNTTRLWSPKSAWSDLAGEGGNNSFSISNITQITPTNKESKSDIVNVPDFAERQKQSINLDSQSGCSTKPKVDPVTLPSKLNAATNKSSATGASWLQKSSWTQLVGDTNPSFSISQVLPGVRALEKQETAGPKSMDAKSSTVRKYSKSATIASSDAKGSKACSDVGNEDILATVASSNTVALATALDPVPSPPIKSSQTLGETDQFTAPKKNHTQGEQPSLRNYTMGETCSFMRSTSSLREWTKAKAALSGHSKKNNDR